MPAMSTGTGSDHGPAGSVAVTKKLPPPAPPMTVVIIQQRPSWYRTVGAKMPSDDQSVVVLRSSCEGRSRTLPIWVQSTRLRDRKTGTPGKRVNDEVTST